MCGIVAINSLDGLEIDLIQSLISISHRGPDDMGTYVSTDKDAYLGQVRLSIIDLSSAGHQPMRSADGRYVLVFNGEIYNYIELRKFLENKYGLIFWKSSTDTEVVLEGFAREGESFFSRLNGIFAIVLYDTKERLFYVLRDPVGIKPLYITEQDSAVYFGSEIKALLSLNNLKRTIRRQSLVDQLAYMYVPEPHTMYDEFLKVDPGVCFKYQNGKLLNSNYLFDHLLASQSNYDESILAKKLHETLRASVERQLISDVPISLFLSGGLDSSSIAVEAVKAQADIKSAYTISFDENDGLIDSGSSDLYYAKRVATELGIDLKIIQAQENFINLIPSLIDFMEDGISDPALINTYLICKAAREDGVKVMLSGQGADEYLCGYRRYRAEDIIHNMRDVSRYALSNVGRFLPNSILGSFRTPIRQLKRLSYSAGLNSNKRLASYFIWGEAERIRSLFLDESVINPDEQLIKLFNSLDTKDSRDKLLLADQKFDLRSLNLSYTDKLSMSVGVEVRVPFLDFEMISIMNSIPRELLIKNGEQKYLLKKAMENYLPNDIIYRKKAGFGLPIRSWFLKPNELSRYYFSFERLSVQKLLNPLAVNGILEEHYSGRADHSYLMFGMLCQQIWLEKAFK
jgi:asparagine synthase (glutamine-hydrolysing)